MKPQPFFKRSIFFILLTVVIPCLFFVAIEVCLRFFFYSLVKQNKNILKFSLCCGYKLQPNPNSPYEIDRFGFRRTPFDFSNRQSEEVYRIVTLGDSITFGSTNDEYLNYPAYLEFILNSPGFKPQLPRKKRYVDIINAGIIGYTSEWTKNYLMDTILDFNPDAVIVSVGANDLRRSYSSPVFMFLERHIPGFFWFYSSSALISNLRKMVLPIINQKRQFNEDQGKNHEYSVEKRNYALLLYKENLTQIVETLKARKIESILVPWPLTPGVTADHVDRFSFGDMEIDNPKELSLYKSFTKVMREIALKFQVPLIQTPFQIPLNPPKHNIQFFMASSIHLNNAGSRILAYSLADAIRKIMKGKSVQEINAESWGNRRDGDVLDFYVWVKENFEITNEVKIRQIIEVWEKRIADHCIANAKPNLTIVNLHLLECLFAIPDLALNYIYEGRLETAKAYLDYAIRTYPQWAYPFYVYGIHQLRIKEKNRAKKFFETAAKLAPYFKTPRMVLADNF